ncbi:unnamed protein product, partial [Schistocephalus solidus]|uniref:GON-4-like protein n=1 Tax=Schistocephalus solidus TaxID=70667 RepID=A0A183TLY8_SCHSO
QPSSSVDVHHVELSQTSFAIVSDRFQKTSFEAPIISPPNFCSARPPSSPTLPSPSDSIDLQSTPGGSAQPNPCNSTNLPSPAPFYALKLSSGASDSETSLWSPLPSPKPSVFTEVTGRSEPNSLNFNTSPEIKEAPLAGSKMFSEDDSGMECLPLWLKSLRLHKYHVTQGARNKILVSINKLSSRSATLKRLEHEMAGCIGSADQVPTLRGFLAELRSILQTPIARFMGGMTAMTPVSTSMLASVSEGKALHGTHPPTSSPEPSISLVVAEGTAPSTDDVDVEEEEEEEEEDEDNFGNEVSEEDEFGDEEDNPEISDQQDFLGEAFHRPSRPRLLHRERKFAIYSDDIGSGDGVLSRISFNNSDTCLHQPKFPSEGLERTCLRPATSILRRKSSEDVFFFEHHAPARRNSELSIGRTRRPYKQRCHKPTDSTVGAAIDCNSRLIQLATADRRKAQSEPKHLLLATAEMNTSAIPSEPENLPEQIIRCLFQGTSFNKISTNSGGCGW